MDIVVEIAIGALMVATGQEPLACMPERRVPQIVSERDGFDEVAVQPEQPSDSPRDAAYQLHVQAAAADVVVLDEGEHLRLACIPVIGGHVHDLLDVARERGPGDRRYVVRVRLAPGHVLVAKAVGAHPSRRAVGENLRLDCRVDRQVGYGILRHGCLPSRGGCDPAAKTSARRAFLVCRHCSSDARVRLRL